MDVGIWLYDLDSCGYFPWKGGERLFGGAGPSMESLRAWTAGKPLGKTSTCKPTEQSSLTEVYFLGMERHANGDYLIAVWNRLPANRQHVASVGVADLVGAASAETTPIDANRIPGYATYFWIMPAENRFAAIRLKHKGNGIANFRNYMTNFLRFINPAHVVLGDPDADGTLRVKGYRRDDNADQVAGAVRCVFSVKSIPLGGDLALIRENVANVERVIVKTTLMPIVPRDYEQWQTMLGISRIVRRPAPFEENIQIKVEMPVQFDEETLNDTIANWTDDVDDLDDVENRSNDIGFKIRGIDNTKWLSKTQARIQFQINVEWVDNELVNMESLLHHLAGRRAEVLALG